METMEIDINNCARCGGDHEDLEFRKFTRYPVVEGGKTFEWWAACPILSEPILLMVVEGTGVVVGDSEIELKFHDRPPAPTIGMYECCGLGFDGS